MRVLAYYPWIYLKSGIERTLLEYAKRSRHEMLFVTNRYNKADTFPEFAKWEVKELPRGVSVKRAFGAVASAAIKIALTELSEFDYDVLMVHCDGLGNLALFRNHEKPSVCICHTPLRIAYDAQYISRYCDGKLVRRLIVNSAGTIYRYIDRKAWRYYEHVVFVSREVRDRCARNGMPEGRHSIIYPGVDEGRSVNGVCREPFLLCPGRVMWTKNIESAIHGFRLAKVRGMVPAHMRLVVAGMVDEKSGSYVKRLREIGHGDDTVVFVESPSDETLNDLYARCFAVVFPAFNEDWGIVPLEAMSFGKVVISSNRGGPKESMIDGRTGWLVEPDAEGMAAGMGMCIESEARLERMASCCLERAREFTWARFAGEMDGVLDAVESESETGRRSRGRRVGGGSG